jgi:hypothetical protein
MPSFDGYKPIILQPYDSAVCYQFGFSVCSTTTANDGSIPYGLTISNSSVRCHKEDGTVCTTGIVVNSSHTGWVTSVLLTYPTTAVVAVLPGKYHLTFKLTLSDASIKEFDFNRLIVRNL